MASSMVPLACARDRPETDRAPGAVLDSVGVGPWEGPWPDDAALRPRAARQRRPAQRRRPLPLLDGRGDRRRPRHAPAPVPRRHRELAARPQHRHGRAHRQRVPRRRGAHRRPPALEPARRDGHRPLPARAPPPRRRRASPSGPGSRSCRCSPSTTCRAPSRSRRRRCPAPACCCSARRAPGSPRRRARTRRRPALDRPVRLHPVDQRRRRRRHRDARMDQAARRADPTVGANRQLRLNSCRSAHGVTAADVPRCPA